MPDVHALRAPLSGDVAEAARALVGAHLVREGIRLRITEVEAYAGPEDSASHARHGRTHRNAAMWGPPGHAYLYFCYGMHWMLNVVTGAEGQAAAVLIRGCQVVEGLDLVLARRKGARPGPRLLDGPGKVTQALGLDRTQDGMDLLADGPLRLEAGDPPLLLEEGPRVGIAYASPEDQARPWRFRAAR